MSQLYYETVRDGLVPVEFVSWATNHSANVRVTKAALCYKLGEMIEASVLNIVSTMPKQGIFTTVRQAALPQGGRPR